MNHRDIWMPVITLSIHYCMHFMWPLNDRGLSITTMSGEVVLIDEGLDGSHWSASKAIFGWLRVAHIGAHFLINSVSLAFTEIWMRSKFQQMTSTPNLFRSINKFPCSCIMLSRRRCENKSDLFVVLRPVNYAPLIRWWFRFSWW